MEILFEICRYWVSRVKKDERGYVILQVTGTDEQHPYVDNNAYTNYCVAYILKRTLYFEKKYGNKLEGLKNRICISGTEIEKFKDRKTTKGEDIYDIEATIYCLRESHKGIIIGKGGSLLKKIAMTARYDIEEMLGTKVN